MQVIGALVFLGLAVMSLRRRRWAYVTFVVLGLLYFPATVGFHLSPRTCELALDVPLAIFSLTNYKHIVLFALFFVMTSAQLRRGGWAQLAWAGIATVLMGVLVELAEGATGGGHCRLRDLVPDTVGALLGAGVLTVSRIRWRAASGS